MIQTLNPWTRKSNFSDYHRFTFYRKSTSENKFWYYDNSHSFFKWNCGKIFHKNGFVREQSLNMIFMNILNLAKDYLIGKG